MISEVTVLKKQLEEEVKEKNIYMTKFAKLILERNQLRDKLANALRYINSTNIKLKETKERLKK
jgi:hypothetical protein